MEVLNRKVHQVYQTKTKLESLKGFHIIFFHFVSLAVLKDIKRYLWKMSRMKAGKEAVAKLPRPALAATNHYIGNDIIK